MKINSIDDLVKVDLPGSVMADINGRIRDWLASGGSAEDEYIKQQLIYAEKVAEFTNRRPANET